MGSKIYHVNVFTNHAFKGNPAAVVLLDSEKSSEWMQNFAIETNQPVTSFIRQDQETKTFYLRWFYIDGEAELCGHGTLAAAQILWETGVVLQSDEIVFQYPTGSINIKSDGGWGTISLPKMDLEESNLLEFAKDALQCDVNFIGKSSLDYLIEVADEESLRNIEPDYIKLATLECRGIIVTSLATQSKKLDFVSRFFSPKSVNKEDPVTGSAHAALFPYWQNRLGMTDFVVAQISSRGGELKLFETGDNVGISGQCIVLSKGEITDF